MPSEHPQLKHKGQPSRREREKARKRQEILDVALELFTQKGYHNVTMHAIAEGAEFAVGTLYKFFRNKDDLYMALVLEKSKEFHDATNAALVGHTDEVERLRNYIKVKSALLSTQVPMIRLYFSEIYGESFNLMTELNTRIREHHRETLGILAAVFEAGMQRGYFRRSADPHTLAIALDAITTAFLFRWLEDPQGCPYPEDPDVILDILFKGLVD